MLGRFQSNSAYADHLRTFRSVLGVLSRDGGPELAALRDVKAGPAFGDGTLNGLTAVGDEGMQHPTSLDGLGTVGPLPRGPQNGIGLGLS